MLGFLCSCIQIDSLNLKAPHFLLTEITRNRVNFSDNKNQGHCLGIIKTWKINTSWDIAHGHKVLDMETSKNLWINLQKFHSGGQPIAKTIKIPLCLFY